MVILIGGVSCTGKTVLAQKLLEEYKIPYLSIDHVKMGLIRGSKYCDFSATDGDVVMRYGFNEFTLEKWKATFELQRYFEERIGTSIYSILPNVKENTFGF